MKYMHPFSFQEHTLRSAETSGGGIEAACKQSILQIFPLETSTARLIALEKIIGTSTCLTFYSLISFEVTAGKMQFSATLLHHLILW